MNFPLKVTQLSDKEAENFEKSFANKEGVFNFEGVWLRNQCDKNKHQSKWQSDKDARRRYIKFFDTYKIQRENDINYLTIINSFIYISNTYPVSEIEQYNQKVLKALEYNNYELKKKTKGMQTYVKDGLEVSLFYYNNHPRNKLKQIKFPDNYKSLDILIKDKNNPYYKEEIDRMWKLSTKMFRMPDKRENPRYIKSAKEILEYLPAQLELGCGPSIEVGIPPLHNMHETYKVQNHKTKQFYFADEDTLAVDVIADPIKMYTKFAYVPKVCIKAKPNKSYKKLFKLFDNGYFKQPVLNNNFDRIISRQGIKEKILRVYDINKYIPKINFDRQAKSLICIGTHADRRKVQKQAREKGLKVIFIDPEGFYKKDGSFEKYPIEGPQDNDLIYQTTFNEFINEMEELLLKG
ncbi:MAG: hypothetical protein ACOCP8_09660 [archaeon]